MEVIKTRLAEYIEQKAKEEAAAKAAAELAAKEKAVADMRIAGPDRWTTARAVAMASLPVGPGVLIAADGTMDIVLAVTRSREDVRVLPVRAGAENPPSATLDAIRLLKPQWIRIIGGEASVTKSCALALAALI